MRRSRMWWHTSARCRSSSACRQAARERRETRRARLKAFLSRAWLEARSTGAKMKTVSSIALAFAAFALVAGPAPGVAQANSDCLACHADASLQNASGHSVSVNEHTFELEPSRQLEVRRLPHDNQGISPSGADHAGQVRNLPCRPGHRARRKRALGQGRASMHQLPWRCSLHFSQGRLALGGLSAQYSAHLRSLPRQRRNGQEARPAECLPDVYRLDPRLCAQQRGIAGGG